MDKDNKIDFLVERLSLLSKQRIGLGIYLEKIEKAIIFCKRTKTLVKKLEEGVKIKAKIDLLAICERNIKIKIKIEKDKEFEGENNGQR